VPIVAQSGLQQKEILPPEFANLHSLNVTKGYTFHIRFEFRFDCNGFNGFNSPLARRAKFR